MSEIASLVSAVAAAVSALATLGQTIGFKQLRKKSLIITATFTVVLLAVYIYGNRSHGQGQFEWQFAGDGWIGVVDIEGNQAHIEVDRYVKRGEWNRRLLFASSEPGTVERKLFPMGLRLRMPVKTTGSDGRRPSLVILDANLAAIRAYAGRVYYRDGDKTSLGGMLLVPKN
jgi:hypothetical protein